MTKTKTVVDFIVWQKTGCCLLGYSTNTDIGIVHVGPAGTLGTGNCNTADDTYIQPDQKTRIFSWQRPGNDE